MGDKRRSGFLIPNAKYTPPTTLSSTFHITGTSRQIWIHHHAALYASSWQYHVGERIRYLSQAGAGLMELDYLPSDKSMKMNTRTMTVHVVGYSTGTLRGHGSGVAFQRRLHQGQRSSYFNDFDNKYGSSTDGYATKNSALAMRCKTSMPPFQPSSPGLQRTEHQ